MAARDCRSWSNATSTCAGRSSMPSGGIPFQAHIRSHGFQGQRHDDGDHILEGQLADPVLISAESTIEVERAQASQKVFTQARKSEQSILQELSRESTQAPDSVIWVVDGSRAMTYMSDILEALENWDWKLPCRSLSHPINPPSSHPITPTRFVHRRRPCLT